MTGKSTADFFLILHNAAFAEGQRLFESCAYFQRNKIIFNNTVYFFDEPVHNVKSVGTFRSLW